MLLLLVIKAVSLLFSGSGFPKNSNYVEEYVDQSSHVTQW